MYRVGAYQWKERHGLGGSYRKMQSHKRLGRYNWQVRYYVPFAYQSAFGKSEVLRSLKTTVKGEEMHRESPVPAPL